MMRVVTMKQLILDPLDLEILSMSDDELDAFATQASRAASPELRETPRPPVAPLRGPVAGPVRPRARRAA